jgi:hypothetical protein
MLHFLDVNITARPVKPTGNYRAQGRPSANTTLHEADHAPGVSTLEVFSADESKLGVTSPMVEPGWSVGQYYQYSRE